MRRSMTGAATALAGVFALATIATTGPALGQQVEPAPVQQDITAGSYQGALPNGATWIAEVPDEWNGTMLVFSHGYLPSFLGIPNTPSHSPDPATAAALLDRGYALMGSSFAAAGWALPTAVDDQLDSLVAAVQQIGREPDRVLAYGSSMGGLVTAKLLDADVDVFDGALPMCGIVGGGLALGNYQLDAEHAIDVLLAPGTAIQLVRYPSFAEAFTASQQLVDAVTAAQATPEGRARVALVAALLQVSDRVSDDEEPPGRHDWEARQENQYQNLISIIPFVVPGRVDIEAAVGGNPAWNAGVDYGRLLRRSDDRRQVEALYRRAGLDLDADLDLLSSSAAVEADPAAVAATVDTSVPTGGIDVPVLTMHTVADSLVPVENEAGYAERVRRAGDSRLLRQAWVDRVGHCTFTPAEVVAAVETLDERVETGRWGRSTSPSALQDTAEATGLGEAAFVSEPRGLTLLGDRRPSHGGPGHCSGPPRDRHGAGTMGCR